MKSAIFSQEGADEPMRTLSALKGEEMAGKVRVGRRHPRTEPLNKVKIDTLSITTFKNTISTVTGESAEKDVNALERAGFPVVRRMKQK